MIFLFHDNVRTSLVVRSLFFLRCYQFYWAKNSVTIIKAGFNLTNKDFLWSEMPKSSVRSLLQLLIAAEQRLILGDFKILSGERELFLYIENKYIVVLYSLYI